VKGEGMGREGKGRKGRGRERDGEGKGMDDPLTYVAMLAALR